MQVVMIESFPGIERELGRAAIVDVNVLFEGAEHHDWIISKLYDGRYETVSEFTRGAISHDAAVQVALRDAPEGMRIFRATPFSVAEIERLGNTIAEYPKR